MWGFIPKTPLVSTPLVVPLPRIIKKRRTLEV